MQLLVADAQRHHLARAGPVAVGRRDDLAPIPVALLATDAEDELGPLAHRDVLALPVHVQVAGNPARGDDEVPAYAVRAEAEVTHGLELSELDRLSRQCLRDDRARDVARVLARAVVIEHARDDAW